MGSATAMVVHKWRFLNCWFSGLFTRTSLSQSQRGTFKSSFLVRSPRDASRYVHLANLPACLRKI